MTNDLSIKATPSRYQSLYRDNPNERAVVQSGQKSLKAIATAAAHALEDTRKHLLLVSDKPERLRRLEFALDPREVKMTKASSAEELARSCRYEHELAIIDVEQEQLIGILKTLRESKGHEGILVLVECSRLRHDRSLAGVLPSYRAMSCSFEEILQLTRGRLNPLASSADPELGVSRQVL